MLDLLYIYIYKCKPEHMALIYASIGVIYIYIYI